MEPSLRALFDSAERGDRKSSEALSVAVYTELHRLAQRELAKRWGSTLGPATLLHEAYLGMSAREGDSFPDRARFMGYAAKVMREFIIDHARSRRAQKRGGEFELTSLTDNVAAPRPDARELARIGDVLDELAGAEPGLAQIVDLKFFCGFSFQEIAAMRGISERTVQRMWEKARIYLRGALGN